MKIKDRIKELRRVKASELVPNPKNWRTHPTKQKDALKGVLSEIGYADALLARELPDGSLMLLDGHLRAETTPDQEVPVLVLDLTEEEGDKLLATLDPLASLAEQDDEKLAELLESIETENEALQELLDDLAGEEIEEIFESGENDDSIPEVNEKPVSQRGEIFKLGNHRLMCGDSTNKGDIENLMNGEKADMVFTDPPYNVAIGSKNKFLNTVQPSGRCCEDIENDKGLTDEEIGIQVWKPAFENMREMSSDLASIYVTMPQGGTHMMMMMMMMMNASWQVKHELIWQKNSPTFSMGRLDYDYQHEPICYGWNKSHIFYGQGEQTKSVWNFDKPRKCDLHPTMKPLALVVNAIQNSSKEGDLVIDYFGGSGTTVIACEKTNRKCYMMELDPHYCDVIRKRWAEYVHGEGCDWKALTPAV